MSDNAAVAGRRSRWCTVLRLGVLALLFAGQAWWTERQVEALAATVANSANRLDVLERVGSPSVGQIRLLQMQGLQSADQRRTDGLETATRLIRERIDHQDGAAARLEATATSLQRVQAQLAVRVSASHAQSHKRNRPQHGPPE